MCTIFVSSVDACFTFCVLCFFMSRTHIKEFPKFRLHPSFFLVVLSTKYLPKFRQHLFLGFFKSVRVFVYLPSVTGAHAASPRSRIYVCSSAFFVFRVGRRSQLGLFVRMTISLGPKHWWSFILCSLHILERTFIMTPHFPLPLAYSGVLFSVPLRYWTRACYCA